MKTAKYRILTLDGGGIRGLTSALLLQDLQADLGILDDIDLIAGNSIGGVTAMLLRSGTSIDDIVNIYRTQCCTIFMPYQPTPEEERKVDPDGKLSHLLEAEMFVLYESSGLEGILREHLGDKRLSDLDPVLVPTSRLAPQPGAQPGLWEPVTFHNLPGSGSSGQLSAVDAAMCTSAAPVYFPPYEVKALGSSFADGFVYTDNPSTTALATVVSSGVLKERNASLEETRLLSLGTGLYPASIPPENIGDPFTWGFIRWLTQKPHDPTPALPFITMVPNLNGEAAVNQTGLLMGDNTRRVNVPFETMIGIDACSQIDDLAEGTVAYMKTDAWAQDKQWVRERFM